MVRESEEFWRYAARLYGQNGVEDACLALQDLGLNVNLLLLIFWLAEQGRPALSAEDLQRLNTAIEPWHQGLTVRLCQARRFVKAQAGRNDLYRRLLDLELEAERVEQGQLIAALPAAEAAEVSSLRAAAGSLAAYLAVLPRAASPSAREHMAVLLAAAFPEPSHDLMQMLNDALASHQLHLN